MTLLTLEKTEDVSKLLISRAIGCSYRAAVGSISLGCANAFPATLQRIHIMSYRVFIKKLHICTLQEFYTVSQNSVNGSENYSLGDGT